MKKYKVIEKSTGRENIMDEKMAFYFKSQMIFLGMFERFEFIELHDQTKLPKTLQKIPIYIQRKL